MSYTGGKGRTLHFLINEMPPHDTYIETHLGGGALMRHKRPAARNVGIDRDPSVIEAWQASGVSGLELHLDDAASFLRAYDFTGDELVFSDPPYWPDRRRRQRCYRHDYGPEQHIELLDVLSSLPCRVMLTGYDNPVYSERLARWRRQDYINQTQTGPVVETVWMNYDATDMLHDYRYLGSDFRERERLRRRRETHVRRLRAAAPYERHAVICEIAQAFPDETRAALERTA